MPGFLTAQQICERARQIARVPGFREQSGELLNSILSDLCQEYDLDAAKKTFNFNFTGATAPIGNLNVQLASGPFTLPVDYLRAKIGDIIYWPNGVGNVPNSNLGNYPLKLVPIDIAEFDSLVQQEGFNNFPVFFATDMSQAAPVLSTTGNTHTSTNLNGLASTSGVSAGMGVSGPGIVPGTLVETVNSATAVTLDTAATSTVTGGPFFFGVCPIAYVWPPASGAYPCMVRYQSQMPPLVSPEDSLAIPWFPNQGYLRQKLSAALFELANDDRFIAYNATADETLRKFLTMKDDDTDRAKRVTLDPRRFGPAWDRLPRSKIFGY